MQNSVILLLIPVLFRKTGTMNNKQYEERQAEISRIFLEQEIQEPLRATVY